MLKDSRRGNNLLLDKNLLMFIPNIHLTPQGLVDVDNKWKSDRPVFDSTFCPEIWCNVINDWVDKSTEGQVHFSGSFVRLITSIWNLRITYPDQPIYIGDDDVKNAFRLIKSNPAVVGMHGFVGHGLLGFSTGMTLVITIHLRTLNLLLLPVHNKLLIYGETNPRSVSRNAKSMLKK